MRHSARAKPRLSLLSDSQKHAIHDAVVTVLSKTGVVVKEPRALRLYHDAGAGVDGERVTIPAVLLEETLKRAPETVAITDRLGRKAMTLGTDDVYFGVHGDTPEFIDLRTRRVRPYVLADAAAMAKICDALGNIDFLSQNGFAADVSNPRVTTPLVVIEMMRNTTKPLGVGCCDSDTLQYVLDVALTVRSDRKDLAARPFFYHYSEPTSPLTHSAPSLRRLILAAENGIPLVYTPMVMAGATGPATFAGTVVQCLAESLSGIALAQIVRPGAPCITGGITTIMDMSTTVCSYGAPEMSLMVAGLTEMARYYKLPVFGTAGCTDAPVEDAQYACEATFSALSSALSGAHLVHDVALAYHAQRTSCLGPVLCDEIIAMVRSFAKGFSLDDESLALELIRRVGPQGHFLTEEHTLKHFKRAWRPTLFDRTMNGEPPRGKDLTARLKEKAETILATHRPEPLDPDVESELQRIATKLRAI